MNVKGRVTVGGSDAVFPVTVAVSMLLDREKDFDFDASTDSDVVNEDDRESVGVAVGGGVNVSDLEGVPIEMVALPDAETDAEAVALADAEDDCEGVLPLRDADQSAERVSVHGTLLDPVAVADSDGVFVGGGVSDFVRLIDGDGNDGLADRLRELVPSMVNDNLDRDFDFVGGFVSVFPGVCVGVGVLNVADTSDDNVAVVDAVSLTVDVALFEALSENDRALSDTSFETEAEADSDVEVDKVSDVLGVTENELLIEIVADSLLSEIRTDVVGVTDTDAE